MFMRVGVPEFGAYAFGGLRVGIAGLVLLPLLLRAKNRIEFQQNWLRLSLIGLISTGIPFTLYAFAAHSLNAGVSSVINASVPVMTGAIAHFYLQDRLTSRQTLGLVVGLVGVTLLMLDGLQGGLGSLPAFCAALGACLCYAVGSNLSKRYLAHISPLTTAASGLCVSGIILSPLILATYPQQTVSWAAWGAVLGVAVLSTAIAMIIFYYLIQQLGPTKTVSVTLLIPVFGIFWGMLLLDEKLTLLMVVGTLIILSGTALSVLTKR